MTCTDSNIGQLITRYEIGVLEQPEKAAFVSHLIQCEYCHNEIYSMQPFMEVLCRRRENLQQEAVFADRVVAQTSDVPSRFSRPYGRPLLLAASLIGALSVGLLVAYFLIQPTTTQLVEQSGRPATTSERASTTNSAWADVKVPKALYLPSARQAVLRGTQAGSALERGVAAYQQDDYATAAEQFEVISRLDPENAEAHFYWGVSRLLAGEHRSAIQPLITAVRLSAGSQRESSHFYLSLAYLKTGRTAQALVELEAVIELKGQHQAEAESLKQKIDASR